MEREEKPFVITYTGSYMFVDETMIAGEISFHCTCTNPLTITKRDPQSIMSGIFCNTCDEQWYIRWSEGILRRGRINHEETER